MDIRTKVILGDVADAVGAVVMTVVAAVLVWIFIVATPTQNSAECDILETEMQNWR